MKDDQRRSILRRGLRFRPNPTDVIVSTFVKSGTTWATFIAHLLRSGADVDFGDISQAVVELTWAGSTGGLFSVHNSFYFLIMFSVEPVACLAAGLFPEED